MVFCNRDIGLIYYKTIKHKKEQKKEKLMMNIIMDLQSKDDKKSL